MALDPVSMMQGGIGSIGLVTSVIGTIGSMETATKISKAQQDIGEMEMQQNALRQQQMTLQYQRQSVENLRNTQKTIAMNKAAAVNQGGQYGSGVAGGVSGATSAGAFNQLGLNQNFQLANSMFSLDSQIDQQRINLAGLMGQQSTFQGVSQLGGGIMQASGPLANLGGNFFGKQTS